MPLGDDEDDFPSGSFLERMEDDCLAPAAAIERFDVAKALGAVHSAPPSAPASPPTPAESPPTPANDAAP